MSEAKDTDVWVFDVDGCLIDSMSGSSLRPLARDVLEALSERGATLVLWSAGGADYARRRANEVGIESFFVDFFAKTKRDSEGRWSAETLPPEYRAATFVDDQPDEAPRGRRVVGVRPYLGENDHDRGLEETLRLVRSDDGAAVD